MPRKGTEVFLIDSSAGLGIDNQRGLRYLVNLNEYLLEKSRELVGRENNNHSVVAGIVTIIFSVKSAIGTWLTEGFIISAGTKIKCSIIGFVTCVVPGSTFSLFLSLMMILLYSSHRVCSTIYPC